MHGLKSLQFGTGSYKLCSQPHPPTLTHTHPHIAKKRSHSPTQTHPHTAKKRSHSPTPSQIKVTITHTHPHPAKKRSYPPTPRQEKVRPTHTQPHPAKKGHTYQNPAINIWERKFFLYPLVNQIY